jgi:hydrogenase expression/formation protein HypC
VTGDHCRSDQEHCITCGDDGTVMSVLERDTGLALCTDDAGRRHRVAIDLVEPVQIGDRVLVHAGVAIGHLEAVDA